MITFLEEGLNFWVVVWALGRLLTTSSAIGAQTLLQAVLNYDDMLAGKS